ncbi:MAG: response regulator [Nitrospirota bacterium]|nr:response regulator [Nitrospirota bacterium]MDH5586827.1 response regulator [Nitrospirota bacterium]MDH5774511.1 response regulator [Nitrospirota bacterium]
MSKSMLIIEDDVVGRDLLRLVFEYDGFHCSQADNGAIGLDMMALQTYDAIILDNSMPVMTGLEFLAQVQRLPPHTNVPIIMITGYLNRDIQQKAEKLGAYAIVEKPYDLGELRALVNQLTSRVPAHAPEPSLTPK